MKISNAILIKKGKLRSCKVYFEKSSKKKWKTKALRE